MPDLDQERLAVLRQMTNEQRARVERLVLEAEVAVAQAERVTAVLH